ncbi:hypothetical protein [Amycolatopsis sp. NPDC003676]
MANAVEDLASTNGPAEVYLSFVEYTVGTEVPIGDLSDEAVARELDTLRDQGVRTSRVAERSLLEMAAESASRTCRSAGGAAVDSVVFSTETLFGRGVSEALSEFLVRLGTPLTPALAVGGAGIGDAGPGLATARNLIRAEGASSVLLVTADAVAAGSRYLTSGTTVLSDGAAACLLTREPAERSFKVLGLAPSRRTDNTAGAEAAAGLVGRAVSNAFDGLPIDVGDCRYLLTGHYGRDVWQLVASAANVGPENVYRPLADEVGHCFAVDVLAGLGRLAEDRTSAAGDVVLLVTTGPRSCTAVVAMLMES